MLGLVQLSSSNFLRSGGSSRRPAFSSSREVVLVGSDSSRTIDVSSAVKISSVQRGLPIVSSEQKHPSSGRNSLNIKTFESTLRGIESLHFNNEERVQY